MGGQGTINDAIYTTGEIQPAGSGVLQSFVRLDDSANSGTWEGHNTSGRPLENDENTSPTFTRDLLTSDVPLVDIGGVLYREFLFDINENMPGGLLNLNEVRIYQSDTASLTANNTTKDTLGTLIYNMDGLPGGGLPLGPDNTVVLDWNLIGGGSGKSDMFLYVPDSNFLDLDYVYLWSGAGIVPPEGGEENAGFEEWAVQERNPIDVPEPGTLTLLSVGLLSIGLTNLARRRRKAA
jgi:hypothetical protein